MQWESLAQRLSPLVVEIGQTIEMSDEKNELVEEVDEKAVNKHDWSSADLEKVTDFKEEEDLQSDGTDNKVEHLKAEATAKVINVAPEDVKFLVDEFELNKGVAERLLIKHRGDLRTAVTAFLNF
ncbi:HYPK-UBA domain-containing protein [Aphelenchoides fujianensis]|nr:HYPK-UBA domain-containing protein [Aphelenchoides fujianensis]